VTVRRDLERVTGSRLGARHSEDRHATAAAFRYLDAGRLANARTVERMTLLSGELGQRYRFFPRMNYRLLGKGVAA